MTFTDFDRLDEGRGDQLAVLASGLVIVDEDRDLRALENRRPCRQPLPAPPALQVATNPSRMRRSQSASPSQTMIHRPARTPAISSGTVIRDARDACMFQTNPP